MCKSYVTGNASIIMRLIRIYFLIAIGLQNNFFKLKLSALKLLLKHTLQKCI